MRTFKIPYTSFQLTLWWWRKGDARQRKPTTGFGLIVERR